MEGGANQKRITDYFEILTDIERLIINNKRLSASLQTSMHESRMQYNSLCSTVLRQIIVNAEANAGNLNTQRRYPEIVKKFSMALFIYAGPMAYEFIHQNMPEAFHLCELFKMLFIHITKRLMKDISGLMTLHNIWSSSTCLKSFQLEKMPLVS